MKGWNTTWVRRILLIVIIIILLLALLPEVLRLGALHWLRQQEGVQAELADIDLNLFTGQLSLKELQAVGRSGARLACERCEIEINWQALWQQRMELQQLRVKQMRLDLRQTEGQPWQVGIFHLPPVPKAPTPPPVEKPAWGFGINELALDDVALDIALPALEAKARVEHFVLGPTATWQASAFSDIALDARLNEARIQLEGRTRPLSDTPILEGRLGVHNLQLGWLQPLLPPESVTALDGVLNIQAPLEAQMQPNGGVRLTIDSKAQLAGLRAHHAAARVEQADLQWQGPLALDYDGQDKLQVQVDGRLQLAELDTTLNEPPLQVRQAQLEWRGQVDYRVQAQAADLQSSMNLTLSGLQVSGPDRQELLQLKRLKLDGFSLDQLADIRAAALTIDGVHALKRPADPTDKTAGHVLGWQRLKLEQIAFTELHTLSLKRATLTGLDSWMALNAKQPPEPLQLIKAGVPVAGSDNREREPAPPALKVSEPSPDDGVATLFRFRIGAVDVNGDNRFVFQDNRVQPPVRLAMEPFELSLGALDSARPEQASPFRFSARFHPAGRLQAQGDLHFFAMRPTLQLEARLQGFELLPFDSYTRRHLGYRIKSGQLNLDSQVALEQGLLDSDNRLQLKRFRFTDLRPDQRQEADQALGVPPGMALSLLRDSDGMIALSIPVTGDINDPRFDLSGVVSTAVLKGVKLAILNYYSPLLAVTAADALLDLATALRFEPISFAAGSSELGLSQQQQLQTLARILRDRPDVELTLCGIATQQDLPLLRTAQQTHAEEQHEKEIPQVSPADGHTKPALPPERIGALEQLAKQRSQQVRRYLIENGQVAAKRLYQCNPELELVGGGEPRVEIGL